LRGTGSRSFRARSWSSVLVAPRPSWSLIRISGPLVCSPASFCKNTCRSSNT
jgi:hypothetical protein